MPSTALVARYTLPGDASLDGIVNGSDLGLVVTHYHATTGTTPPEWYEGDVNYDGVVDSGDLLIVAQNFNEIAVAPPTNVTVGVPYTLTLPTSTSAGTPTRWDSNWGDGTNDSYSGINPSHTFTTAGPGLIQATAVTYTGNPSVNNGYGVYHLPAIALNINSGASLISLPITAAASDTFNITSDGNGNTVVTQNGNVIDTIATDTLLSLSIAGDTTGTLTVDYSNGDPLPSSGLSTDSQTVDIIGDDGGDDGGSTLATTSTSAIFSNSSIASSEIRHLATASISLLNAGSGDTIAALVGTTFINGDPNAIDGPTVLVNSNAEAIFTGTQYLAALDVLPGGTARMAEDGTSVLVTDALNLAAPANGFAGGILDLADNDLIVHGGSLEAVQSLLANGYNGGAWNDLSNFGGGPAPAAIDSATAAENYNYDGIEALGYAEVGQPNSPTAGLFDGQPVANGDVVVRFTYYGDANLDGVVNSTDEAALANGEANNLTGWNNGDFDYSGVIDDNDAALLDASESFDLAAPLPPAVEGQQYSFTLPGDAVEANTDISTVQNWQVRWGNGTVDNYAVPAGSSPDQLASHTYSTPNLGEYSVAVSVTGTGGYGTRTRLYTDILPHEDVVVAPDAPTDLSATESTAGEVDLTWTDDSQLPTGYTVTATPTGGGTTITQTYNSSTLAVSFTGLTADVTYTFTVAAVSTLSDGVSAQSTPESFTAAAPTVSLSATGPAEIDEAGTGYVLSLSSGSGSDITGWQVAWMDDNGNTLETETAAGANGTVAFPPLAVPVLYATVSAYDSSGNTFTLQPMEFDVVPNPPTDVQTTVMASTEIDVSWQNNSAIASGFDILRSDDGGSTWTDVGSVGADVTTFADTGLDPSSSYEYEVVADNSAAANGGVTTTAGGTAVSPAGATSSPSAPATTPTGMPTLTTTADPANAAIQLTWTFVGNNDEGFELEAEDTTIGENFHTISLPGPVSPSTPGGVGYDQYSFGVTPGDNYNFRIRVDYTDGTVSDYVGASASLAQAAAPTFSANVLEYSYAPYQQYIQVAWGATTDDNGVNIEVSGNDFAGPGWRSAVDGDNSGDFGGSSGSPPDGFEGCVDNPGVDVTFGGNYSFRVRSFDQYGNPTAWSAPQSASLGGSSAGPTMSFTPGSTSIAVSWTVSDPTMNSFLYMATSADGVVAQQERPVYTATGSSTAPTSYTATVSNLIPGTQYYFNLKTALPSNGYSIPTTTYYMSNGSSATTGTAPVAPPAAPQQVRTKVTTGNTVGQNSVQLTWTNTSNNESGFKVERRCLTGDYPNLWVLMYNTNADVTKQIDVGMKPGDYQYRITAYNSGGANSTTVSVGVWPPGHLEALDGTTDTWTSHTVIARFVADYRKDKSYQPGVPDLPLITGAELADQIDNAYSDVLSFYQDAGNRFNDVPLDIVGYSRGGFAAMVLMSLLNNYGIPILETKRVITETTYGPFGIVLAQRQINEYSWYKPKIRFVGLMSPVGQSSLISELAALATLGLVQFNPGFNTTIPDGTGVFATYYPSAGILGLLGVLQNPIVLPQAPTVPGAFIPPSDNHVSIAQDQTVEVAMWEAANGDNVPIPERPSDVDAGGI